MLIMNAANLKLRKKRNPRSKKNNLLCGLTKVLLISVAGLQLAYADKLNLKLEPGQKEFSFSLPSNPTTGYRWSIHEFDASKLKFSGEKYHGKMTGMMGAGGQQSFHFMILKPHQKFATKIELVYARPWEKKVVKTQDVEVKNFSPHFFNLFKW